MKHNRLISLTLALLMMLSLLTACGGGDKPDESGKNPGSAVTDPDASKTPEPAADVDLAAFYEATTGKYEFGFLQLMDPSDEYDKDTLDMLYPGMTDVAAEQCLVYVCMISMNNGEFGLVQVSDAADVETVKNIFQARIDYMVGDGTAPGGAQYPMSMDAWENNSRIVANGNYVMMVVHEDCDDIVNDFNALF